MDSTSIRVGVISDTHDLLRESAIEALQGVDHILHVGDVCSPVILKSPWDCPFDHRLRQYGQIYGFASRGSD